MNEFSAIATFFKEGGSFMWFMLATAIVAVAISVERFIVISRASGLNSARMIEDLVRAVGKGDLNSARNMARQSNAPAAQVASAILNVTDGDITRMQNASDDAATLTLPALSRRLPHLNVLANVATLLGLLGTIAGLITAFSAVGAADPAQRSAFMAKGISTALNATAFGLLIAIPTLILQGVLVGMVERVAEQVDEMSIRLTNAVSQQRGAPPSANIVSLQPQRAATPSPSVVHPGVASQGGAR